MVLCPLSDSWVPTLLAPVASGIQKAARTLTESVEHHRGTIWIKDLRILCDRHPMLKTLGSLAPFCAYSRIFKYEAYTGHTPATVSLLRSAVPTFVHDEVRSSCSVLESLKVFFEFVQFQR